MTHRPTWLIGLALVGACSKSPCEQAAAHYAELYGGDLATLGVDADGIAKFRKQFERAACARVTSDMACIASAKTLAETEPCLEHESDGYLWRTRVDDALTVVGQLKPRIETFDKLATRLAGLRALATPASLPERCPTAITDIVYVDADVLGSLAAHKVASVKAVHAGAGGAALLADYVGDDVHDIRRLTSLRAWVQHATAPGIGIGVITPSTARPPALLGTQYFGGEFAAQIVVVDATNQPVCRVAGTAHSVTEIEYSYHPGEEHDAGQAKLDEDWSQQLQAMMNGATHKLLGTAAER